MASTSLRLFVSHSHLDNDFGMKLVQDLRHVLTDENAVFYDVMGGLHGGDIWWEKIVEELTARDAFLLILSPDAMNSLWVRREINIALNRNKLILPLLYRACTIRADLEILQVISFLAPHTYEASFRDILLALHLTVETPPASAQPSSTDVPQTSPAAARLIQQIATAFTDHDWADVIHKVDYLSKRMPESMTAQVSRWQGIAFSEEGEEAHAQEAFQTALALVSDREERLAILSDYTALLVRQQQWRQVLKRSREALYLVPHDPAWQAMHQQAQDQLAQHAPHTTPSQQPERRSEFYSQIGKKGRERDKGVIEADKEEEKHSTTSAKTKEQWLSEGNTLYDHKRYEEALIAYEQAIRLDPNYAFAYYNKGNVLRDFNRFEEALTAYERAIRSDPNYVAGYHGKGFALQNLKRYEEALNAYEQTIRLDPNYAAGYHGKGVALEYLNRYEEALTALEQAIRLNPNAIGAYHDKGVALQNLKRDEEALMAYEQAIHLDPNSTYANTYYGKAVALETLNRDEEALIDLEQAIHLYPNDANTYYAKGYALDRLGKKNEAQKAYDKARQLGYRG